MNHKAIYALYSNVVSISDRHGAVDANGNKVSETNSVVAVHHIIPAYAGRG